MDDAAKNNQEIANVHEGIIAVMSALGTLDKANQNKFDKYDYASIDDFIAFVRKHCFGAGIFIGQDEVDARLVDVAKKDGKAMAMWWARYAFTVHHKGGTSIGPIHRTVMVQANGAQSSGAAMAYALKQFMRSIFLIPTGDADPDSEKTEISAHSGASETDLQKKAGRIRREFLKSNTAEDLKLAWQDNAVDLDHIKRVSETASEFLLGEYHRRMQELEAHEQARKN